ncbi:MAG: IS66 family insertion sequence element accessory protein TnpA [Planctomycetaceae bacterium]
MARSVSDVDRVRWRERLRRFERRSGSVEAFCQLEGISVGTLYQWRRRLARESGRSSSRQARTGAGAERAPATTGPRLDGSPDGRFAALSVRPVAGEAPLRVLLPGGTRIEVPVADLRLVRLVLRSLVTNSSSPNEEA